MGLNKISVLIALILHLSLSAEKALSFSGQYALGIASVKEARYAEAQAHFSQAKQSTDDVRLKNLSDLSLARINYLLGEFSGAESIYQALLESEFKNEAAFEGALSCFKQEKFSDALKFLKHADKNQFQSIILSGEAYLALNRPEEAAAQFQDVLNRQENLWEEVKNSLKEEKFREKLPEWISKAPELTETSQLLEAYNLHRRQLEAMRAQYKILSSQDLISARTPLSQKIRRWEKEIFERQMVVVEQLEAVVSSLYREELAYFGLGGKVEIRTNVEEHSAIEKIEMSVDGIVINGEFQLPIEDFHPHELGFHVIYRKQNAEGALGVPQSATGRVQYSGRDGECLILNIAIDPRGGNAFSFESGGLVIDRQWEECVNPLNASQWQTLIRKQTNRKMQQEALKQAQLAFEKVGLDSKKAEWVLENEKMTSALAAVEAEQNEMKRRLTTVFLTESGKKSGKMRSYAKELAVLRKLVTAQKTALENRKWAASNLEAGGAVNHLAASYIESLLAEISAFPDGSEGANFHLARAQQSQFSKEIQTLSDFSVSSISKVKAQLQKELSDINRQIKIAEGEHEKYRQLFDSAFRRDLTRLKNRIEMNIVFADNGLLQILLQKNQQLATAKEDSDISRAARLDALPNRAAQ